MTLRGVLNLGLSSILMVLALAPAAHAGERYAVIVSGPSGGERFAELQQAWRNTLTAALVDRLTFAPANVIVLGDDEANRRRATRENVRAVLADLRRRTRPDDLVLLVLFGHGTIDGTDAKFNLAGPDLAASDWKALLDGIAARLVVVNTTESSFPYLEELSVPGRIVITATDSAMQRYATVFPDYFVKAIADPSSDIDRDGRIAIWEMFEATSEAVKGHYEQKGQLSTERSLLDDNGDKRGREGLASGSDGALARTIFLDGRGVGEGKLPPTAAALAVERRLIEGQIDELRLRRPLLREADYTAQLEALLVRLARITRQLQAPPPAP